MRGARHPALSVAAGLLAVTLVATMAGGCGSSSTDSSGEGSTKTAAPPGAVAPVCTAAAGVGALRVSGVDCATGREVVTAWIAKNPCATPAGASRTSCTVGAYRCLSVVAERGIEVSCARPGRSISFAVKRR